MRRSFKRKSGLRDARLIVIAAEGELTEKQYFYGLTKSSKYKNPRVHVEVLSRGSSISDPKECIKTLNKFKRTYHLNVNDELWLVCDVDRWGQKKLSEVNQLCRQKRYLMAVSNPCFESWLLIHKVRVDQYTNEEIQQLVTGCQIVVRFLKAKLGSYNKSNLRIEDYIDDVQHAINEGRRIDQPLEDWPLGFGSKVFLLVESIIT